MNANQFNILATLSIGESRMPTADLLNYLNYTAMPQGDREAVKQSLAVLIGANLVGMEIDGSDWKASRLWLTARGTKTVDLAATIRMEEMLQDWQTAVTSPVM